MVVYVRERAAREPGAGDLPDAGPRVSDRPAPLRHLQAGQRRRHAARRRADRPARHHGGSRVVKIVFFDLFLFATGYKVGPQFFRGPQEERAAAGGADRRALRHEPVATVVAARSCFGYDCGTAAGLMAGAFTESTVIGTAGDAIRPARSPGGGEDAAAEQHPGRLRRQLPGGHRLRRLVPVEPGAPAARRRPEGGEPEARATQMSGRPDAEDAARVGVPRVGRAGVSPGRRARRAGRVARSRASFAPERVFVERIRREAELVDARPRHRPAGRRCRGDRRPAQRARSAASPLGDEVEDRALLDFPDRDRRCRRDEPGRRGPARCRRWRSEHGRGVVARQARPRRRGDSRSRRRPTVNRGDLLRLAGRQRGRRARRPGARLHRAAVERDRRRVRRPRHPRSAGLVGLLTVDGRRACRSA